MVIIERARSYFQTPKLGHYQKLVQEELKAEGWDERKKIKFAGGRPRHSQRSLGCGSERKSLGKQLSCSRYASSPYKSALTAIRGAPAAGDFLLFRRKKVTKENATPVRCPFGVPCAARTSGRLRNSRFALRLVVRAKRPGLGLA
jgi:hypothetical protein